MYKTGSDKESLLGELKQLSQLTGIDRVVRPGGKFKIIAEVSGRGLKWSMDTDPKGLSSKGIQPICGKGYPALAKTLKMLDRRKKSDEGFLVLALADASTSKNYDDTIHTIWYCIDPCAVGFSGDEMKVDHENGFISLRYPIMELDLTEKEYKSCCACKVALFDEFAKVMYPFQECSYPSISYMLGLSGITKYASNPLVLASLLAERMASTSGIRFLYRVRSKRVFPLMSIIGRHYTEISQYEFMKEAYSILQENEIIRMDSWRVTDENTLVRFTMDGYNALWHPEIEISLSDVACRSLSVTANICMGRGKIELKRNSSIHRSTFEYNGGVKGLFEGIFEAIRDFSDAWDQVSDEMVLFDSSLLEKHKKMLGKKRVSRTILPDSGTYLFSELIYQVVDRTHASLSPRWEQELNKANLAIFQMLAHNPSVESTKEGGQKDGREMAE